MTTPAIRELLASFRIEVDPEGNLLKGHAQVDAFKKKLAELNQARIRAGERLGARDYGPRLDDASGTPRRSGIGPQLGPTRQDMWRGRAFERADAAAAAQFGPTRQTLMDQQRALFVQRTELQKTAKAALDAAQVTGGPLRRAFDSVRESLNAPRGGFISSLFTMQNAFRGLVAGAAGAGLLNIVKRVAAIGAEASRLGVTNAEFQQLNILAQANAISLDGLGDSFAGLAKAATAVGTSQARDALESLGVQSKNANGEFKDRIDLFWDTAEALAAVENRTERGAKLQMIFGEGARRIAPILEGGTEAVKKRREELSKLTVVSDSTIEAAKGFTQSWEIAKVQLLAIAGPVLEQLVIPAMNMLLDLATKAAEGFKALTKGVSFTRIAFVGAVLAISPYVAQLRALVALGGGWTKVLGGMAKGGAGIVKSWAPLIAAFLALEDALTFLTGGDSAIGFALDQFFGEGTERGVQKTVLELTEAFKDLWKWILGDGAGEKSKALFAEITQGFKLMINDALAQIPGSGRTAGLEGLEAYERGQVSRNIYTRDTRGTADPFLSGHFGGPDLLAPRTGTTIIDNSTRSVEVNMSPGSTPAQVAETVKRLAPDRNSTAARVP